MTGPAPAWPDGPARDTLIDGLARLHRHHHESPDCWYSCPKSARGCCNDTVDPDRCTCGADAHNRLVDDLLAVLEPAETSDGADQTFAPFDEALTDDEWRAFAAGAGFDPDAGEHRP